MMPPPFANTDAAVASNGCLHTQVAAKRGERSSTGDEAIPEPGRTVLANVLSAFDAAGVDVWVDQGALLGLVRDGALIPWDSDIDLGVWRHELNGKEWTVVLELLKSDRHYHIILYPAGIHIGSQGSLPVSIAIYDRVADTAIKLIPKPRNISEKPNQWRLAAGRIGANLAPFARSIRRRAVAVLNPESRFLAVVLQFSVWLEMLGGRFGAIKRVWDRAVCDARFFEDLESMNVSELAIAKPREAESYLEFKFGADWRTPRKQWQYWTQDGAILHAAGR